jgi:hypothetical protein
MTPTLFCSTGQSPLEGCPSPQDYPVLPSLHWPTPKFDGAFNALEPQMRLISPSGTIPFHPGEGAIRTLRSGRVRTRTMPLGGIVKESEGEFAVALWMVWYTALQWRLCVFLGAVFRFLGSWGSVGIAGDHPPWLRLGLNFT